MPARINGIGTTYLGKRDVQVQQGVCESCRRAGPLSNYETRLWFTVFFIPVIPLTKKQILNYCPRCTRHRALGVEQWRQVQAEAISGAMASVDANPDSPEHAVECHATMAACGKREEAAQYADAMASRFGNNAEVLMYLGGWFERTGQSSRADACFDRALAADPQHPGALRAAAVGLAQQNKPREAEAKLATLQPSSEHFDPALFFAVGQAYQNVGDHESASRLFKVVAVTTPTSAKDKKFRQAVQRSEAALGRYGSVLAPIPWYKRRAFWWSALAAAVLAVIIGFDRHVAWNRELFVVNGLPQPLKVRLDGGEQVQVPPIGRLKLSASEGTHTISVIEPTVLARDQEFTVDASILGRWRGRQVIIVDPTRSAVVVWEESVYAANAADQRDDFKLHAAEPFVKLDNIDYKFEEFPNQLQVEGRAKSVTKHRVGLMKLTPLELLVSAPDALAGDERLDFLEAHLATDADRQVLLQYYWASGIQLNQLARCREYLKKSLAARPVDVDWHRSYQATAQWSGDQGSLLPEYDAMLAKDPANPDLLYLRGRIEPYGVDSAKFFDAALQKVPDHGFIWAAKAYHFVGAGKFDEGLAAIEKAITADNDRGEWKLARRNALQALGRHDQVIRELEEKGPEDDGSEWAKYPLVIDILLAQGKIDEAQAKYEKLVEIIDRDMPGDPLQLKSKGQLALFAASKKYGELRAAAAQSSDPLVRSAWSFTANLCDGKLDEAAADVQSIPLKVRGIDALCLSIAWRNAHREEQAQEWLKQGIELLSAGSSEQQIMAGWLREPPADLATLLPKLTDLTLEPDDKVIVLLVLAANNRPGGDQLIEFAKWLNAWPSHHNAFVDAALAAIR